MTLVIARIILRYLAGALLAYGLIDPGLADRIAIDPDLAELLGLAIGVVTEAGYAFAKSRGGTT